VILVESPSTDKFQFVPPPPPAPVEPIVKVFVPLSKAIEV
jgi:hypothetical protein